MSDAGTHIIKQQIIELDIHPGLDPFGVQQQVSDHYRQDLIPLMLRIFDERSMPDTIIQLEKLQIDIGTISVGSIISGQWLDEFQKHLEEKLQEQLQNTTGKKQSKKASLQDGYFEQWMYFLRNGWLPWNAAKPPADWYEKVLESLGLQFNSSHVLRKLILEKGQPVGRLIQHHPDKFLSQLTELLTAQSQKALPVICRDLTDWILFIQVRSGKTILTNSHIRKIIWTVVFKQAAASSEIVSTEKITEGVIEELLLQKPEQLLKALPAQTQDKKFKRLSAVLEKIIRTQNKTTIKGNRQQTDKGPASRAALKTEEAANKEEKNKGKNTTPKKTEARRMIDAIKKVDAEQHRAGQQQSTEELTEQGAFVPNAGVVLLHIFFSHCFKKLGWVKNGKFTDPEKQTKGVYLIHYLATSQSTAEEYELVLPKLLCGWPLQQTLEKIILGKEEMEEADGLLASAIAQWQSLKSTSAGGLQVNFLQRGGKLFISNEKWYLQVESMPAVDLLLDSLPWTLSMVKLPWMENLLRVEWR